jgi:hypothetical protein
MLGFTVIHVGETLILLFQFINLHLRVDVQARAEK